MGPAAGGPGCAGPRHEGAPEQTGRVLALAPGTSPASRSKEMSRGLRHPGHRRQLLWSRCWVLRIGRPGERRAVKGLMRRSPSRCCRLAAADSTAVGRAARRHRPAAPARQIRYRLRHPGRRGWQDRHHARAQHRRSWFVLSASAAGGWGPGVGFTTQRITRATAEAGQAAQRLPIVGELFPGGVSHRAQIDAQARFAAPADDAAGQ